MKNLIMKLLMYACISTSVQAQQPFATQFKAEQHYLKIPIKNGAKKRNVEIKLNDKVIRWFTAEIADQRPDWYAHVYIGPWKGSIMEIKVDTMNADSKAFSPVLQTNDRSTDLDYKEPFRAQFHFSARRGWNNDPNGLAYYNGEYHLFFQHNPYGINWGNMHWGHAVSKDLVHWQELDIAVYPDQYGTNHSGGGIYDWNNSSGLGGKDSKPLLLFYTAAEYAWNQAIAYSNDGRTFTQLPNTILPKITDTNRDPKVIWHEPSKKWVMILYVPEKDDLHTMHFFNSSNLKDWEFTSKYVGGQGDDRYMFECPELFELSIDDNPNNKKWILTGGNSQYAIGSFDGKVFKPEVERLFSQVGRDYYAAQTFDNEPKGRRVEIGWWRTYTNIGTNHFNQSMSIPMELKLKTTSQGVRVVREPVDELKVLRGRKTTIASAIINGSSTNPLSHIQEEISELRIVLEPQTAKVIKLHVRGLVVRYDVKLQEIVIDNVRAKMPLKNGKLDITMFVDRTGLEILANDGEVFMPINYNFEFRNHAYILETEGGTALLHPGEIYALNSIWKGE